MGTTIGQELKSELDRMSVEQELNRELKRIGRAADESRRRGPQVLDRYGTRTVVTQPDAGAVLIHTGEGIGLWLSNGIGDLATVFGFRSAMRLKGDKSPWTLNITGPAWVSYFDCSYEKDVRVPEGRWGWWVGDDEIQDMTAIGIRKAQDNEAAGELVEVATGLALEAAPGEDGAALRAALGSNRRSGCAFVDNWVTVTWKAER